MVAVVGVETVIPKLIHVVLNAASDAAWAQPGVARWGFLLCHGADVAKVGISCLD